MGQATGCCAKMAHFRKKVARNVCIVMMGRCVDWDANVSSQDSKRQISVLVLWDCDCVDSFYCIGFVSMVDKQKKSILFVCSSNLHRSKTAEDIFSVLYQNLNIKSAGTNQKLCQKHGRVFLTEDMLSDADMVFVMEDSHKNLINKHTDNLYTTKIRVLHIPDEYKYGQEELIVLLKEKTQELLHNV